MLCQLYGCMSQRSRSTEGFPSLAHRSSVRHRLNSHAHSHTHTHHSDCVHLCTQAMPLANAHKRTQISHGFEIVTHERTHVNIRNVFTSYTCIHIRFQSYLLKWEWKAKMCVIWDQAQDTLRHTSLNLRNTVSVCLSVL